MIFRRILMNSFAEGATHSFGQENSRIAVFVPQFVCSGQRARPLLSVFILQEVHLLRSIVKVGSLYSQQSYGTTSLPVVAKELTHGDEDLTIHGSWSVQGMSAGKGAEIGIAQFQVPCASGKVLLAKTASDHFTETKQG